MHPNPFHHQLPLAALKQFLLKIGLKLIEG